MATVYHEVLEAAQRLKDDKGAKTLAESPYGKLVTQLCSWNALRAKDEALVKEWALERLLTPTEEEEQEPKAQVRCFVCDVELGEFSEAYPAVIAAIGGNYGSTVYDPIRPLSSNTNESRDDYLYLHICDMCLCEKANYLASNEAARNKLSSRVLLDYETVESFSPELKARYKRHLEWAERNT
jgi:hypothetical protein